jgi:competence protein ComEC
VNRRAHLPALLAACLLLVGIAASELGWRAPAPPGVVLPMPGVLQRPIERLRSIPLVTIDDPRAAAVASGVIFGRTEHVTPRDQQAFLDSGLWHLLAASGQNVALVAGCCVLLARAAGAGRTTGAVLALVAIPGYVLIVGGGASIVRAGLMGELALLAWLAGRLPHLRQLLLVAAATICWLWPGAHRSLGMQLSFACVVALAIWASPMTRTLEHRGVPRPLAGAVAATVICSAATAPILLLRTGAAPLTGVVANLLAVPVAGVLLVIGLAGSLVVLLGGSVLPNAVDRVAMWPAARLAAMLLQLAARGSSLPAAQTTSPLVAIGVPIAMLALVAIPRRQRALRRTSVVLACACLALPVAAALARHVPGTEFVSGRIAPPAAGVLRIGVLDIGQGDATLLASGSRAVLVDTGPPDGRVVARVRALGVSRIDGIVLTHDSLDHRGGFDDALAALHPSWVAMPAHAPGPWRHVREAAPRLVEVCAGSSFRVGSADVRVLHPPCDGHITPRTSDLHNDGAIVLLVSHGDVRAVLPADAEAPVLLPLALPRLDLLRVSHHGSADPALAELLARVTPQVAAISVGAGNDYGHPTSSTLRALTAAGVRTLRTDRDGTIAFDSDGRVLRLVDG